LKTNFYQPTKVALSFRLAPTFLPEIEYPQKPFGMFIVIGAFRVVVALFVYLLILVAGNEFRGFHLRFRDVARGGIRIVMSRNPECVCLFLSVVFHQSHFNRNYSINQRML
jgi:glutamate dehydrogenase